MRFGCWGKDEVMGRSSRGGKRIAGAQKSAEKLMSFSVEEAE